MVVHVNRARNLPDAAGNPYVKVKLHPDTIKQQKQKSLPQKRTRHPELNEHFKVFWYDTRSCALLISCTRVKWQPLKSDQI